MIKLILLCGELASFSYLYTVQKEFESGIQENRLFSRKDKLLLAVSGGIDSVVLAHLLKKGKFNFSMAHCNFKLRGKDSDADEKFCRDLSSAMKADFYSRSFDTKQYSQKQKLSIQMAARTLRYAYFYELFQEKGFDYILTAHHSNDLVETVLINLLRGTGIKGLVGIPVKNYEIIRPMLGFSKEMIEGYAKKNKIRYRADKSNSEDKYERNFLRHKVIPLLKKLNPSLETTFVENTRNFRDEALIVKDFLRQKQKEFVREDNGRVIISKVGLKREIHIESVLHFMLEGYGFNKTQERNIVQNILSEAESGRSFNSKTHRLLIDREEVLIESKAKQRPAIEKIDSIEELEKESLFSLQRVTEFAIPASGELLISESDLVFPLTVRPVKAGDKFKPFGMKGFKLLSDFLKDEKLNNFEKENVKLLVNGNGEIIWVVGHRSDERYRVKRDAKQFLKLSIG